MNHLPAHQSPRFRRRALLARRVTAAAALCISGVAAHAAGMNMAVTSNVASSAPITQNYATSTPADLATTHTLSTTVTSYGSFANGWAEGARA